MVKSLAEFKRFLATPGATVQVIQNDWTTGPRALKPKDGYFDPKQVAKLQTNAVQFTSGGWLTFPKAAHVQFKEDTMIIDMNDDGQFTDKLVYRLTLEKVS